MYLMNQYTQTVYQNKNLLYHDYSPNKITISRQRQKRGGSKQGGRGRGHLLCFHPRGGMTLFLFLVPIQAGQLFSDSRHRRYYSKSTTGNGNIRYRMART